MDERYTCFLYLVFCVDYSIVMIIFFTKVNVAKNSTHLDTFLVFTRIISIHLTRKFSLPRFSTQMKSKH